MTYRPTIGLEIHAELKTQTKMFCACLNNPDELSPNKNICPVCMAHPGTLPVINKEAIHKVLLVGTALGATLADFTEFDRKNYFYPDIPKGYQLSQYKYPLVSGGALKGVTITRVHLEEDTARSQHLGDKSLVDYNRAGVPLMELVTEPVIHDAETAGIFARELQLLLRTLGAGEANMEKGEMRVEANISVSPDETFGTKVEVKNLNSFRSVERAIAFEIARQTQVLNKGEKVVQETRGWDEARQETFSQRKKESSHDYRYFPDPDLPKLVLSEIPEFSKEVLTKELPELPWTRREKYISQGISKEYADIFVSEQHAGYLFDSATKHLTHDDSRIALTANYVANNLAGNWDKVEPAALAVLVQFKYEDKLSSAGARDAINEAIVSHGDLKTIVGKYMQQSDGSMLEKVAREIAVAYPQVVQDYKAGKDAALQFLIGQGMRQTKGSANPAVLKEVFIKILG